MAGEVNLRATLARPFLMATGTPQVAYLLIEAMPSQVVAQVRMPVNVSFVLDRSGSMQGDKLRYVETTEGIMIEKATPPPDDPFATFSEWSSEADDKAYADL